MPMSTKRKAPTKLAAPVARLATKLPLKSTIDESRTHVSGTDALHSSQREAIEISSDEDSDEDVSDEDGMDQVKGVEHAAKPEGAVAHVNGAGNKPDAEESDGEPTSPSFGELLRDNEAIDVPGLLQLQQAGATSAAPAQRPRTAIVPPSHQSLTTVLSQALRTDDADLLESCLHTTDLSTIRNTIERLDSSLAGTLLTKLAARLYRRPGRAGNLMTWVQWSLVAHGGALASQPQVVQSLDSLQKVLAERAKGLNSLLALKGKLDLLEGQMDLRRKMKGRSGLLPNGEGDGDEDDVVWVEGEETDVVGGKALQRRGAVDDEDEAEAEDDVRATNGFVGDSEDDEPDDGADEDLDEDSGGVAESVDEDEVDHEDVDESMGEEEESDVETAAPPSKAQKVSRSSLPRRK